MAAMRQYVGAWSEDEKREVERLLLEGLNTRQIGLEMGRPRNAIVGIVHRTPFLRAAMATRLENMNKAERYSHLIKKPAKPPVAPPPIVLPSAAYDAQALRVSLLELRSDQCKFPVTDDHVFLFCGHQQRQNSVYCEHHALRCVQAPRHHAP